MDDVVEQWQKSACEGWVKGLTGQKKESLEAYEEADKISSRFIGGTIKMHPELSVLRHMEGEAEGIVESLPPTEETVVSLELPPTSQESTSAEGMSLPKFEFDFDFEFDPGFHKTNIKKNIPHIMVMSSGRCGTVSLYHLFERYRHIPYHTYFWQVSSTTRYEMAYRMMGEKGIQEIAERWVQARAAEWIGCISQNRPMVGLNHYDTVFAPIFARMHPQAKFIYLRRDPVKTFESFYGKNQWSDAQIAPLLYKFDPEFRWRRLRYDTSTEIAWYLRFTEEYSRQFGATMGNRWVEISSDKLFEQNKEEINKLEDIAGIKIDPNHFKIPYNQKSHKVSYSEQQMDHARDIFRRMYDTL